MNKENPEEAAARADEIIKNTYRTLITRGMKGCYIYCTDAKLSEYIRKRLPNKAIKPYPMIGENTYLKVADEQVAYGVGGKKDA